MNIIKKILFTLSIMLVWGVGKEVAQNIQGSRAGLLTLIISLVGTWVIYDIWFGSFFFSKNVKNDVNSNQKRQKIPHSFELANETLPNKNTYISDNKSISSVAIKPTDMGIDKRHVYEDDSKFDHSSNQKNLSINREISMDQISNFIDEDVIYEKIADELDSGSVSKGLWTKLFAKYDGDEVKIKAEYIRQRFSKLQKDAIQAEKNKHQKILKSDAHVVNREIDESELEIENSDLNGNDDNDLKSLISDYKQNIDHDKAVKIAQNFGYDVSSTAKTGSRCISVKSPYGQVFYFNSESEFQNFVLNSLC